MVPYVFQVSGIPEAQAEYRQEININNLVNTVYTNPYAQTGYVMTMLRYMRGGRRLDRANISSSNAINSKPIPLYNATAMSFP